MSVITVKAAERMRTSHMFSVMMTSQFTRQFEYLFFGFVIFLFCFLVPLQLFELFSTNLNRKRD